MAPSPPDTQQARMPVGRPSRWRMWVRRNSLLWLTTALIVVFGLVAALLLMVQRDQALEAGARLTDALAAVVDEQTSRTIQTVDQRLLLVTHALEGLQAAGRLDQQSARTLLRQQIESLPFVRALWTLDANGRLQYDSDEGNIGVDLSDRDYFAVYRSRPTTGFYLGNPVRSRSIGTWLVSAARPLAGPDGRFAGVVVAALEPPYFDRVWESMALESGSAVSLMRIDGTMLLRSPLQDAAMGRDFSAGALFTQHLPGRPFGNFQVDSPIDGTPRLISYRTLANRPDMVVVIGRSRQAILAPWQSLAWLGFGAWAAISAAAAALAIRFGRLSRLRRRAELESAVMANRLSLACDAAGIVVWDWDLRTDGWYATPTHYTTLGYPAQPGPVEHAHWLALLHPDDRAMAEGAINRLRNGVATHYSHEARLRHADGSYRWTRITGQLTQSDDDGKPVRMVGVRVDVTERKRAELERDQILGRVSDAFVALDRDWCYTFVNQRAGEMFGREPQSLIGKHIWTEFPEGQGHKFQILYEQAMADQQPRYMEEYYPPYERWFENWIYPSPEGLSIYFHDITDRKSAEQALVAAKEYAENLIANASAMIIGLDTRGNVILFNNAAQDITGYSMADMQGRNWLEVLVPRTRFPQVWDEFERLRVGSGAQGRRFENPLLTRTGQERLINWRNSQITERGVVTGTLSFGVDVTDRNQAETALRNSEKKYRMLVDRSPYAILVHQDGVLVMANQAAVDLAGATDSGMLVGEPIMKWIHPDYRAAAAARIGRMLAGEQGLYPTEDRYLRVDGSSVDVQVTAAPFEFQENAAVQVIALDITARKQVEQALLASEARFRSAFDSSGIGIALCALDGHWLQVNRALCNIVGYSEAEMLRRTFMDITYPDDLATDLGHMDDLFAARTTSFQMEKRYVHRDGRLVWINLTVALVRDASGEPVHTVAQMEDISQRKQLETDLRSSQARLSATLDALPDLMFELDLEGRQHHVHSPRTELLVRPVQDLIGRLVSETLPAPAAATVMTGLTETRAQGHSSGRQIELELPDGPHWFELTMSRKAVLPGENQRFIVLSRDVTPRRQALEDLRHSEERFRQMAENVREAFWLADVAQNRMLYVSPAYETVTGASVASLLTDPSSWRAAMHPDDQERVAAAVDRLRAKGDYDLEYRIMLPDGQVRWIHSRAFPVPDQDGNTYRVAGIMDDITARKSLQLQEQMERKVLEFVASGRSLTEVLDHFVMNLETLLPGSIGSVLLMDPDGAHIRHGAAPRLPREFCDAIDGSAICQDTGSCGTAAHTGQAVMVADIETDRRWRDLRDLARSHGLRACWSVPIRSGQGTVLGSFAFYFDAPRAASAADQVLMERGAQLASQAIERHRAAHALQQSEERYRSLVEWSPLGIGVHQNGALVYVNPAFVAALGALSEQDLLGERILDLILPDEHQDVTARTARILAGETTPMVLRKYRKLDGTVIQVESKGAPITINGAPAVQFTMRDVTAEKAAQSALLDSRQQLRVLSARVLAAQETERRRVAHELHDELGQALTAIKINLQAQNRYPQGASNDLQDENIRIVEQTLQQVRGLALALRPSMLDDLGLVPALRWLAEQTAARHDIALRLDADAGIGRLPPDLETAVFRIVQEALTNIVRHAGARQVELLVHKEGDGLLVVVRDDGAGFDVAAMRRRATRGDSMGVLGMAERAALVGATLDIASTPGVGSTVTLHCQVKASAQA